MSDEISSDILSKTCGETAENLRMSRIQPVQNPVEILWRTGGKPAEMPVANRFVHFDLTLCIANTYAGCGVLITEDHKLLWSSP